MSNYPLKIHLSCLPKKIAKSLKEQADGDGYVHGYFCYNDRDHLACFFSTTVLFNCTRPHTSCETHLIRVMYAAIEVGVHPSGRPVFEPCKIIAHYSYGE